MSGIDYIRLEASSKDLCNDVMDKLINKLSAFNHDTAEVFGVKRAKYQGLTFETYPSGRIVIFGSLHKYHNSGLHNYNDFSYLSLIKVVAELQSKFGDRILDMSVTALEFGLNVNTPFAPQRFTDRCISHSTKERMPIIKDDLKGFNKGISFNSTDYRLKFYSKGLQYQQPINILRLEVKYLRSRVFEKSGINVLSDISNLSSLEFLFNDLFQKVQEVVYNEDINQSHLSRNEERIYLECINSQNWKLWSREKRNRRKEQFTQILNEHWISQDKKLVLRLMREKYLQLMVGEKMRTISRAITQKTANVFHGG